MTHFAPAGKARKMTTAADLLLGARELIERGWTQHSDARAPDGTEVEPWDPAAAAWSLLGSLVATLEHHAEADNGLPLEPLAAALHELADYVDDDSLTTWNDNPLRTHDDIVSVLESAMSAIDGAT
jgi:hypothetical protein